MSRQKGRSVTSCMGARARIGCGGARDGLEAGSGREGEGRLRRREKRLEGGKRRRDHDDVPSIFLMSSARNCATSLNFGTFAGFTSIKVLCASRQVFWTSRRSAAAGA